MERLKCNLTFRELRKDENLYDDVDLTAGSMVDAQYRRVAGYEDNPDVCALPKMPSVLITKLIANTVFKLNCTHN